MPFIIGVHDSFLGTLTRMPIDEHLRVDLDQNTIKSPFSDTDFLPSDIVLCIRMY